ncbi:penicillin-binding protein 2 [Pigmentibacter sp. JX0631]|uniref:peptidoglycan D,D-transpeptidase FtsI family protein n=1 Tax=Pigmentibacter sp. JX0631 TaxID=2976982 RepID=UPI0024694B56|nr:penicillin-binding protein 2 [Pigmentibacter sp. JX0631]WGL60529.1 penicillin-binding protein 2 [Pigmentibacter sp. JX0631]
MKQKYYNKSIWEKIRDYFDPRKVKINYNFQKRAMAMSLIFLTVILAILVRYAWLTVLPTDLRAKLVAKGSKQLETSVTLSKPRATITDRNGKVLAVSVSSTSLYILTKKMPQDEETLKIVAKQIQVPFKELLNLRNDKRNFVWLKRQMTNNELVSLGSLKKWKNFIDTVEEPKRIYPEKDIAAQLIGFVGADGVGLEGVEKIYNSRLTEKPVKVDAKRDARGRVVINKANDASKPAQMLPNLRLSIDISIQQFTQNALKDGVIKAKAKGGSAVVIDVTTGELLAIASYPTYDLNNPPVNDPEAKRFRPVMDAIELGSASKPMWIARALDLGIIQPETIFDVRGGAMNVPGGVIHDDHPVNFNLDTQGVLRYSSNVGMYKISLKAGRERFYESLMKVGFGRSPGLGFPGEWKGRIHKPESWSEMRFANMSFGQGFAISPLQLAHAVTIMVGGGQDKGMNILAKDLEQEKNFVGPPIQFIRKDTSKTISEMMGNVIEQSNAGRIPGILVGGKTGTAQIWSNKDKAYSERTAVYQGIIPANNPKLAIVVVIDEVKVRPAYGAMLAGPVFSQIGRKTVDYLNSQGVFHVEPYVNAYLSKSEDKNTPIQ